MTHSEIQDLLEGYVDETLDRPTRRLVDEHLADCAECRAILEGVEPVDLAGLATGFDERAMRRSVRRSLFRTAVDAALILVAAWLAAVLVALVVVQPLVVNRGGRAADAARATIDLAAMLTPGAVVTGGRIDSGLLDRVITPEVELPLGSGSVPLEAAATRVGPVALGDADGGPVQWGLGGPAGYDTPPGDQLPRLGEGTVATVHVSFDQPLTLAEAQAIADQTTHDLRVTWAGFDLGFPPGDAPPWSVGGAVGYATCHAPFDLGDDLLGATSASFGGSLPGAPASVERALGLARAGLERVAASPEVAEALAEPSGIDELEAATERLRSEQVGVATLVVTGPSTEIAAFLDDPATPSHVARTLELGFYEWATPVCGR